MSDPYAAPRADLTNPAAFLDPRGLPVEGLLPPHVRVLFLVFVWGLFTIWFIYDGWFTTNPEMIQYRTFNRVGSAIVALILAALVYASQAVRTAVAAGVSNSAAHIYIAPDGASVRVATIPWVWALHFSGLSLIPNKRPLLGIVWFAGSQLTFGLGTLVLIGLASRLIRSGYESAGWTPVGQGAAAA